ncbi:MAG: 1-deoxy-D-xylulose-5-phosphate reductoisomerase [Planctomycetes bacterium]|nr:1-deoxy-D-xylulose-5-phosphate reductoisomerase [Planctomycetota bacterium]
MKKVIVLGATGSIGTSVLSLLRDYRDDFSVVGLVAGHGSNALAALAHEFPDAAVAVGGDVVEDSFALVMEMPGRKGIWFKNSDGPVLLVEEIDADICVAAISGTAGLRATFAAAAKGMRILLANKEVLVSAGRLFMDAAAASGAEVLPLDSEHAALWQCLDGEKRDTVEKVYITASGGPFRNWSAEAMADATREQALAHPVWRMGEKISIDSATLANKALELIEAHRLFDISFDSMEVVVHPEAAIHAMAQMNDGSLIACIGAADMRQPASYMLYYPERRANSLQRLDPLALGKLEFFPPDAARFPLLGIGVDAGRRGGKYPALFNAANEAAVQAFLQGRICFGQIAGAVEAGMNAPVSGEFHSLDEVEQLHRDVAELVRIHVADAPAFQTAMFR